MFDGMWFAKRQALADSIIAETDVVVIKKYVGVHWRQQAAKTSVLQISMEVMMIKPAMLDVGPKQFVNLN